MVPKFIAYFGALPLIAALLSVAVAGESNELHMTVVAG